MAVIVAFIIFFQQSPVAAFIMIVVLGGLYFYYKSKRRGGTNGLFRSCANGPMYDNTQQLLTYFLLQHLSNNSTNNNISSYNPTPNNDEVNEGEKARQDLLKILE